VGSFGAARDFCDCASDGVGKELGNRKYCGSGPVPPPAGLRGPLGNPSAGRTFLDSARANESLRRIFWKLRGINQAAGPLWKVGVFPGKAGPSRPRYYKDPAAETAILVICNAFDFIFQQLHPGPGANLVHYEKSVYSILSVDIGIESASRGVVVGKAPYTRKRSGGSTILE